MQVAAQPPQKLIKHYGKTVQLHNVFIKAYRYYPYPDVLGFMVMYICFIE